MAFSNPAGAVVIPTVPVPYQDYFLWSAIQGETFPPTFTASAVYGSFLGSTVYDLRPINAVATFPTLPRIGPKQTTANVLTFTWNAYSIVDAGGNAWTFYPFGTAGLWKVGDTVAQCVTPVTGNFQAEKLVTPPTASTWHSYSLTFTENIAAGTVTADYAIDGVRVALTQVVISGVAPPFSFPYTGFATTALAIQPVFKNEHGAAAAAMYIGAVRVTWS